MHLTFNELLIPLLLAMFLAINMGGSGTGPSFSVAYGANLIRKDMIPGLFGLFVFAGAMLAGKKVALTIGKEIIPPETMTLIITSIILTSISLTLLIANFVGIPQSTSQATVFALFGPAIYFDVLNKEKVLYEIIPTWFILPIAAFLIILVLGKIIYTKRILSFLKKFENISSHFLLKVIVIISSCYVAFAIGSNNVANAAAPIASMVTNELEITPDKYIFVVTLSVLMVAPCFGIGSSLFGYKVVKNTGKEMVEIAPMEAVLISVVTSSLLLVASLKGIPTSLVQLSVTSIMALGICKMGLLKIVKDKTFHKFWYVWICSPLISFSLSFLLTFLADRFEFL